MAQENTDHALCSSKCKKCVYRFCFGSTWACNYISIMGCSRPCPAGNDCTEFHEGKSLSETRPLAIMARRPQFCAMCGALFKAGPNQKYCSACYAKKTKRYDNARNAEVREKHKKELMEQDKICTDCGAIFHTEVGYFRLCPDCRSKTKWERKKQNALNSGNTERGKGF